MMADKHSNQQHASVKPSQLMQGRSATELLFHALYQCPPEEADLTRPIAAEFTTHGLRTKVVFERAE